MRAVEPPLFYATAFLLPQMRRGVRETIMPELPLAAVPAAGVASYRDVLSFSVVHLAD